MKDLISIIVPVYNVERYLERCINSIERQTYVNWELILINDGSSDRSEKICDSYFQQNSKIRFISQNNQGVSSARNQGILQARGKYICFVDADDWIEDQYLECLAQEISKTGNKLVCCAYCGENTGKITEEKKEYSLNDGILAIFNSKEISPFPWNTIYHRDIIELNDLKYSKEIHYAEDTLFKVQYTLMCDGALWLGKQLYHHCGREDSITNQKLTDENFNKKKTLWQAYKQICIEIKNKKPEIHRLAEKALWERGFWGTVFGMARAQYYNWSFYLDMRRELWGNLMGIVNNPYIKLKIKAYTVLFFVFPRIFILGYSKLRR